MPIKEVKQNFTTKLICVGCGKIEEVKGSYSPKLSVMIVKK